MLSRKKDYHLKILFKICTCHSHISESLDLVVLLALMICSFHSFGCTNFTVFSLLLFCGSQVYSYELACGSIAFKVRILPFLLLSILPYVLIGDKFSTWNIYRDVIAKIKNYLSCRSFPVWGSKLAK